MASIAKMFAEVIIAGSYKNLSKSTRGATKELNTFQKNAKKISLAVSGAFAGIALLGLNQLRHGIVEVTKAYQDDIQSQRVLEAIIKNSIKGHEQQKKTVESNITAWQTLSNVQDDKIRPAYGYLIRATKSITKSNRLMNISLNLAAGSNIDLKAAASAVGRAYTGNLMALNKLAPGIKKLKDPLGEVERRFKGLAKLQATEDPFTAMNIVMDEFKEKLGKSFLPVMKSFVQYLQTPEFQNALDDIVLKVEQFGAWFMSKEGQDTFKTWMTDLKDLILLAGDFLGLVIQVKKLFTPIQPKKLEGYLFDGPHATWPITSKDLADKLSGDNRPDWERNRPKPQPLRPLPVVNQYITINGVVSGNDVVKALRNQASSKGQTVLKLIGG